MVIPKMIKRFKVEYLQIKDDSITAEDINLPGGDFRKNLSCIFTIIDQSSEIYSSNISNNTKELLDRLIYHNREKFGEPSESYIKSDYLDC